MITSKNKAKSATRIHLISFINPTNTPVMTRCLLSVAIASSLLLVGCNDDNDKITYANAPQHIASFTASEIDQELQEASAIGKAVTPDAVCGVKVEKISYQTKG